MQWEYSYSSPISCERIREHCFTILPVRQHEVFLAAVERASHIVNEWNLAVNGTAQNDFSGAEDDLWGVMHTLFTPESIPERLVHATQLSQLLFLVDDVLEGRDGKESLQTLKTMFEEIFESPTDPNLSSAPVVRLWLSTFDDMVTTDPRRGKLVINAVKEWLCQISTQEKRDFSTFENYVEYRKIDCGFYLMYDLLLYQMDMTVSLADLEHVREYADTVARICGLTNDYWSWAREQSNFASAEIEDTLNAVGILVKVEQLDVESAYKLLKENILEMEKQLLTMREALLSSPQVIALPELARLVDALALFAGGNHLWSSTCPRYNSVKYKK